MTRPISETPDQWVVLFIDVPEQQHYKVFASWAGGYTDGDRWKFNSGITKVDEDEDNYYFYGHSGSCYQCRKDAYGIATTYSQGVLDNFIEMANKNDTPISVLEEEIDLMKVEYT